MLLMFHSDSAICMKPPKTPDGYWHLNVKALTTYALEEQAIRLGWRKTTPEEFRNLPVLILPINHLGDDRYNQYYAMWQAAKNRAAQEQEEQP